MPKPPLLVLLTAVAAPATAVETARAEPALGVIEARVAGGLTTGGGHGQAAWRASPTYVGAYARAAIQASPWTWLRGGVVLELGDRAAVGGALGVQILVDGWSVGGGGVALVAPYTLYGAAGALQRRVTIGGTHVAPGAELLVFADGDDLPGGTVVAQLLVSVGIEIDAW